uniref:THAP-type domain-containing protein n=1 Tax=Plectus sambesii TaxID=2011161 RepID=A0A914XAD0_9BILA
MERCTFCGWTRKTALPSIRFFGIPKEPGMRRMQWLYALGRREITPRDRVCSVHFRQGRPSNDPSHEDYAPHLYLNKEPPAEVLAYLETLADSKVEKSTEEPEYRGSVNLITPGTMELNKAPRPTILQRKRKQPPAVTTITLPTAISPTNNGNGNGDQQPRRMKLQILQKPLAEAVGVRAGQTVIIKRRVVRPPNALPTTSAAQDTVN